MARESYNLNFKSIIFLVDKIREIKLRFIDKKKKKLRIEYLLGIKQNKCKTKSYFNIFKH